MSACTDSDTPNHNLTSAGKLAPCPNTPNCVCSDSPNGSSAIEPLRLSAAPDAAWRSLVEHIKMQPRMRITEERKPYLRVEAKTRLFRFVDDVEFQIRPDEEIIAVRSASRVGYSDLGANRKRLEAVRVALIAADVLQPAN